MLGADETSVAAGAPKVYSGAARFGASLAAVFLVVALLAAWGYGGLQHQILTLCTMSCFGFRRGVASTFAYAMAPTCHALETTAPLPDLWGVLILLGWMIGIVGCAWWLAGEALLDVAIGQIVGCGASATRRLLAARWRGMAARRSVSPAPSCS